MRLYTFINCYLSSIQQGIQTAHLVGEFFNYTNKNRITIGSRTGTRGEILEVTHQLTESDLMVREWSEEHKTIIVCNGGNATSIRELIGFFINSRNPYPFVPFNEDQDSLDGALTGVGIILPEEIYDAKIKSAPLDTGGFVELGYEHEDIIYPFGSYEYELIKRIKSAPLAR
jgi:hypothetical protein